MLVFQCVQRCALFCILALKSAHDALMKCPQQVAINTKLGRLLMWLYKGLRTAGQLCTSLKVARDSKLLDKLHQHIIRITNGLILKRVL